MNIYQKLTSVRVDLQNLKLKKSGRNQTISYYELGDLLPAVNQLCLKYGLTTRFDIVVGNGTEKAILTVYNASHPNERIDFVAPTADVQLPRGQAIQGLGAKITYMRRYMLLTAFEIVESDIVDQLKIDMTEAIIEEDENKIRSAKTIEELTKVCAGFKNKYKISLITPIYDEVKTILNQKESKA